MLTPVFCGNGSVKVKNRESLLFTTVAQKLNQGSHPKTTSSGFQPPSPNGEGKWKRL